jgi:hypothetical protein
MDTTTITTNSSGTKCLGTLQLSSDSFSTCVQMSTSPSATDSNKIFSIDPASNLSYNTTYKVKVTTDAKDSTGNELASAYTHATGFTTTNYTDTTAPTFSSSSPADSASSVSVSSTIAVTFSEAMKTTTVTTNTSNTTCSGSLQVSSDSFSTCVQMSASPTISNLYKTFTVTPSDSLTESTTYKISITTGVKDASGNALTSQYEQGNGFTTNSTTILHNNLYWQSDYAMGQYSNTYCSNLTNGNRTWRVPTKSELVSLCSNPNSDIDVSRGSDSGVLLTFNPIQSGYGRLCLCMGEVGGNCASSNYCSGVLGCGNDNDYNGWATKCVSAP